MRLDNDTTDLEKCLYVSFEKISESQSDSQDEKNAIIILGASGGRIDHTISAYSNVYKYLNTYSEQQLHADIFLASKSSFSVYLNNGCNRIIPSMEWENKKQGYSVIPMFDEGSINVIEGENEFVEGKYNLVIIAKQIKFGETFFFRKNHNASVININVSFNNNVVSPFIYSFVTKYHK